MSDNFGVYNITGSVSLPVSSSVFLSGTNDRRLSQRSMVSQSLTFHPMSSSMHEATSLNAFLSGSQALEASAVPASASVYYSKQTRLRKLMYKLSASAGLADNPGSQYSPSVIENYARNTFDPVSGSHRNNSYFSPAVFEINVPEYGKIRDVKVWVELLHDHRSGPGVIQSGSLSVYRFNTVSSLKDTIGLVSGQTVYIWDVFGPTFICTASIAGEFFDSTSFLDVLDTLSPADKTSISSSFYYEGISFETGSSVYTGGLVIAGPGALLEAGALTGSTYGGGIGDANRNLKQGLQGLQIALRSPNVKFQYAHPLWNDEQVSSRFKNPVIGQTPELLRGSYLLWAGHAVETDLGQTLGDLTGGFSEDNYFDSKTITSGNIDYAIAGRRLDVSTDEEGRPAALFYRSTPNHYVISDFRNDGWRFFTLADLGVYDSEWCRIDHDASSKEVYVMWQERSGSLFNRIKFAHAKNASSSFSVETVDEFSISTAGGFRGLDFKIISGSVHCVYATSDGVFLSKRTGSSSWEKNTISITNSLLPSIDSDSTGKIFIGFADYGDNSLKIATTSSAGLSINTLNVVDYSVVTPGKFQLVVDSDDNVHMMCLVQTSGAASYDTVYAMSSSNGLHASRILHGGSDNYSSTNLDLKLNNFTNKPEAFVQSFLSLSPIRSSAVLVRKENLGFSTHVVGSSSYAVAGFDLDVFGNAHFLIGSGSDLAHVYTTGSVRYLSDGQNRIGEQKTLSSLYQSFDTDIDIRTIFSDSSKHENPRSILIGTSPQQKLLIAGAYASPSSASLHGYFKYPTTSLKALDTTVDMTGSNVPWMLDDRVRPGFLYGRNYSTMTASDGTVSTTSSLPPAGWLTGPGNTADVNEWPTSGMSLGPNDIKPVYPLLDDVYVEKIFDEPTKTGVSTLDRRSKIVGFRPGLRGTEVHGKWKLLIGNSSGSARDGWWFRQFRLEFTVDSGEDIRYGSTGQRKMLFSKPSYVPQVAGQRIVGYVSGSAAWDIGVDSVSVQQREEFGRTVGIVSDKNVRSFAVYSAITGSFYDQLSGSGKLESIQRTFLDNEFGTPYIPISSGSFEVPTFDVFDASDAETSRNVFNEVLNPKTLIPKSSTISSHVSRAKVLISTRDEILKKTKT